MTPDGTPVIGPTKVAGLYLNTGHGTLGWTMSSGSARVIADLVSGRKPRDRRHRPLHRTLRLIGLRGFLSCEEPPWKFADRSSAAGANVRA